MKQMTIGTTGDYPPFSFWSENGAEPEGIDIDLIKNIAEDLDWKIQFVKTSWKDLLADFMEGTFNMAVGGIAVNDERSNVAEFSRVYYSGGKKAVVRKALVKKISSIDKAAKYRVITNMGGTNEQFADKHFLRQSIIKEKDNLHIFDKLLAGEADIFFTDSIEADYRIKKHPELSEGLNGALFTDFEIALLLPKDEKIKSKVDDCLDKMEQDGIIKEFFDKWL